MDVAPLTGIRVIESGGLLVEFAGKLLAGMGAEVIKIEPPGGSISRQVGPFASDASHAESSLYFCHYNQSKKSVVLDLDSVSGRQAANKLLETADVLLTSGTEWGAAHPVEAITSRHPRLIVAIVTPWGRSGPYTAYKWSDLVLLSMGGLTHHCGYDEPLTSPIRGGGYQAINASGQFATQGIMLAWLERQASGVGQVVDVAAQHALAMCIEMGNLYWHYNQVVLRRQTGRHAAPPTVRTQRTQHLCRDGRYVNLMLRIQDDGDWSRLSKWLTDAGIIGELNAPEFTDRIYRGSPESAAQIQDAVESLALMQNAEDFYYEAQRRGLICGVIRSPEELLANEHLAQRNYFVRLEQPGLDHVVTVPGSPWVSSSSNWLVAPAPSLGAHTREVMRSIGYADREIDGLITNSIPSEGFIGVIQ